MNPSGYIFIFIRQLSNYEKLTIISNFFSLEIVISEYFLLEISISEHFSLEISISKYLFPKKFYLSLKISTSEPFSLFLTLLSRNLGF